MTDKLLNCPFCGGESWLTKRKSDYDGTILYGGRCINTGCCEIPAIYTKAAAISKWNTRKPMDRIVEQLEKLRQEYPYKVVGEYDTYTTYNEAWSDCSDRAIAIVKGVQND